MRFKEQDQKMIFEKRVHKRYENPKVSVIVPVYKVDRYLTCCLDSIVNQTMEELEIIIVDEGDQDRCREIIDFFEKNDPRVIAPHQKNGGYGASCNLGISMAKGEYISIIESDDFIEPEMYEEMYEYATLLKADVVKTPYYEYMSDGTRKECPYVQFMRESVPQNVCFSMKEFGEPLRIHASLWNCLYRTSYMHQKGIRFVEAKGASYVDVGFRISSLINTNKVAYLDKAYYNYRIDSVDSSTNNFKLKIMLQRWKEQHEMFSEQQDDYDRYYGPQLILDEYLNSVGWLWLIPATDEEYKQIEYNLSFVKEDMIRNTKYLTAKQKADLIEFKKSPDRFKSEVDRYRNNQKILKGAYWFLDKLSNPILLLWLFVGFLTCAFAASFQTAVFKLVLTKYLVLLQLGFLAGIVCCFMGKLCRKLINIVLEIRRQKKNKYILSYGGKQ